MNVYKFDIKHDIKNNEDLKNGTILILGKFNIFHKGHLELINYAFSIKNEKQKIGILIINEEKNNFQSLPSKLHICSSLKIDFAIISQFNFEFKSIEGKDFIKYLDKNFFVQEYISGEDFFFGKDRKYQAKDITNISKAKLKMLPLKTIRNVKISSSNIKEMHELGEYNLISELVIAPLSFDVNIQDTLLFWNSSITKPHYGNYYFKLLIDDYWYHGIINFSITQNINYQLIDKNIDNLIILDQSTQIQILNIERIIINSRFDNITKDDVEKTKKYFISYSNNLENKLLK